MLIHNNYIHTGNTPREHNYVHHFKHNWEANKQSHRNDRGAAR